MQSLQVRWLGRAPYLPVWRAMQTFTDQRDSETADELWLLEHAPVFTQGQAGKPEHLLDAGDIPVVQTDRGGQITFHGPGQLVVYLLLDLRRIGLGVRELVTLIEQQLIALLADYGVTANARSDAPGVYHSSGAKLAQLGLRIRRGCSFHGLSLNLALDTAVFQRINPCGQPGLAVTSLAELLPVAPSMTEAGNRLVAQLVGQLGYTPVVYSPLPAWTDAAEQLSGEAALAYIRQVD